MFKASAQLNESQIEELMYNVDVSDCVEFKTMDEWNHYMDGMTATDIIDSIDINNFDTGDEYAVMDGLGQWYSSDSLMDILEPYLDEMLQEYIDNTLS